MSKTILAAGAAIALVLGAAQVANAGVVTLTFEGLPDQGAIGDYYNGGGGGNFGISFGPDSLALISNLDGGSGDFSNAPSGDTIAFFLDGPGDVMDVAAGFDTGFSFFYAAAEEGSVSVYSGLDGTGTLLASLDLPVTPDPYNVFVPIGVTFAGVAQSAVFSGSADYIGFDNITLGSATPGGVPEPATWTMMIGGLGLAGAALRRRRSAAAAAA